MKSSTRDAASINLAVTTLRSVNVGSSANPTQKYILSLEQMKFINIKAQKSHKIFKNLKSLDGFKFYLCIPSLSREEKMAYSKFILNNGGSIKTNLTNVDYIILNDECISSHKINSLCRNSHIRTLLEKTWTNLSNAAECKTTQQHFKEGVLNLRMRKLMQQNSISNDLRLNNEEKFENLFDILSSEKHGILLLNDFINIINRLESWKNSKDWFTCRLSYSYGDSKYNDLNDFMCIASFDLKDQQMNDEMFYHCEGHQFCSRSKQNQKFEGSEMPSISSVFQSHSEINFDNNNHIILSKKFSESTKGITSRASKIGKGLKHKHKEPKPIDNHDYCFVCRDDYLSYFDHIESNLHKNSIHFHQKYYNEIDQICSSLMNSLEDRFSVILTKSENNEVQNNELDNLLEKAKCNTIIEKENFSHQLIKENSCIEESEISSSSSLNESFSLNERNDEIKNRIKRFKNTPQKCCPNSHKKKTLTPIYYKFNKKIKSAMKQTLIFDHINSDKKLSKEKLENNNSTYKITNQNFEEVKLNVEQMINFSEEKSKDSQL